ncbi:substrate-binding domain-containing protein [Candidatus Williamhamiltonella defendens]|uniref:DNA-binding transcriptional regulator CytR n=1 Tax=Candidatus Williamhamiltonella defendens TaxID=138072 RepID=A0A2D3TDV7_9ENTR|nr:substrate-binding domain-containing protein [Candidatus Hamiltonella defensa]ATW34006.1 DNA-binding transcriptional regulator CytR [Candidatus Hamiltonella defensa]
MSTMKKIAAIAGVSTATVSRAFKSPEKVSVSTRDKVERAVTNAGYYSNALFRNIKRTESRTILVCVPNFGETFFDDIIKGITEIALKKDYQVLINDSAQNKGGLNPFTIARQIAGIVFLGSNFPLNLTEASRQYLPPIVMVNEFISQFNLPTVHIDNLAASFNATNYLHYKLGHRRIACISGIESHLFCQNRLQGYIQALHRSNIPLQKNYIIKSDFGYGAGAQSFKKLMALPKPPTAIFCHNDLLAVGAIYQAKKQGIAVPNDVSIMGFDDLKLSEYIDPALTTVSTPRHKMGEKAAELLLAHLDEHKIAKGSYLLESSLLVRESTGYLKKPEFGIRN